MRSKLLIALSTTTVLSLSLSTVYASASVTVRSGDSLWKIANEHHVSVQQLESWNHLSSNSTLHPGQTLYLGGQSSSSSSEAKSSSSSSSTYVVQSGDSPWSISRKLGVSLSSLESANGLSSKSVIHVGQKLRVPGVSEVKLGSRDGSPDSSVAASARGFEVAQYAQNFKGIPYVWGGTSPSGFDCSGFVQYVYAHFGVSLPRTSYDQYSVGSSVSSSNLEPGDIVFFDTYGSGASHDGIYVGNGQFINAASSRVEIDSLGDGYWGNHFIGARRV